MGSDLPFFAQELSYFWGNLFAFKHIETILPKRLRTKLGRRYTVHSPYFSVRSPTQGHFVLSLVSLASRDQDDDPVELNDRHLRSHGKIGDCEQSRKERYGEGRGGWCCFGCSPPATKIINVIFREKFDRNSDCC